MTANLEPVKSLTKLVNSADSFFIRSEKVKNSLAENLNEFSINMLYFLQQYKIHSINYRG